MNTFFILGAGVCEMTYLYETLFHFFHGKEIKCSSVACTGIVEMIPSGGQTNHSVFQFLILIFENPVSKIKSSLKAGYELRETKFFIFNETSMILSNVLYCLDRLQIHSLVTRS